MSSLPILFVSRERDRVAIAALRTHSAAVAAEHDPFGQVRGVGAMLAIEFVERLGR
jgi:4-aminobutyrate aminotransferase-like enzyme